VRITFEAEDSLCLRRRDRKSGSGENELCERFRCLALRRQPFKLGDNFSKGFFLARESIEDRGIAVIEFRLLRSAGIQTGIAEAERSGFVVPGEKDKGVVSRGCPFTHDTDCFVELEKLLEHPAGVILVSRPVDLSRFDDEDKAGLALCQELDGASCHFGK